MSEDLLLEAGKIAQAVEALAYVEERMAKCREVQAKIADQLARLEEIRLELIDRGSAALLG